MMHELQRMIVQWNEWLADSEYAAVIGQQLDHADHIYEWSVTVGGYFVDQEPLCCHTCELFVVNAI
jgi:hypothetical protein